jgi:DNA-binding transcriptional regulator YdaS (Cro superfamily)
MIDARTHHDPAKAPGLITEALAITGKQTELAARLGVTPKYLQFLKSGRSTNMSYLLQVALERLIAEHQDSA